MPGARCLAQGDALSECVTACLTAPVSVLLATTGIAGIGAPCFAYLLKSSHFGAGFGEADPPRL